MLLFKNHLPEKVSHRVKKNFFTFFCSSDILHAWLPHTPSLKQIIIFDYYHGDNSAPAYHQTPGKTVNLS
jgi:hypothetical protein